MRKRTKLRIFMSEAALAAATLILLIPIYYFLIGAFKSRLDIVKFPLVLTPEMLTFGNFTYAMPKMKLISSLTNTGFITVGRCFGGFGEFPCGFCCRQSHIAYLNGIIRA